MRLIYDQVVGKNYMWNRRLSGDTRLFYSTVMKDKGHEKDINYIIVSLCRGLADYDANEIVSPRTATGDKDNKGHHNNSAN